jgi:hypothetical protein
MDIGGRRTLSPVEAEKEVGVSRRSIWNWMQTGKVEWVFTAGKQRRIFADTLWRHHDAIPHYEHGGPGPR